MLKLASFLCLSENQNSDEPKTVRSKIAPISDPKLCEIYCSCTHRNNEVHSLSKPERESDEVIYIATLDRLR